MDKEVTADRICAASDDIVTMASDNQGPRSKLSSGGAKEECVKENLGGGDRGGMLVDFYSVSLK